MTHGRRPSRSSKKKRPRRRPAPTPPAGSGAPDAPQSFALSPRVAATKHPDRIKQRALEAFLEHGTVLAACNAARIGRTTWYEWRQNDAEFNRLANEAEEAVTDALEEVAQARATMPAGSDTLLIFLLKARRREKYADRQVLTMTSPEVIMKLQAIVDLVASREQWKSEELLPAIGEVLK